MRRDSSEVNTAAFDFMQEISKEGTYRMLFPQPLAGLAILEIYTKIKVGLFPYPRFKESEIYTALENVNKRIKGKDSQRQLQDYFNSMISDLQVYFLRYDTDDQLYSLKDYAVAFCQHAEEILEADFNPTQIEIICNTIRESLDKCTTQGEVDQWIYSVFDAFKPRMKAQVDHLERQIDQSVKEIREATQLANAPILEILRSIDQRLDGIRAQNDELRSAFREVKNIDFLLETRLDETTDATIGDHISEVRRFFPEIKYTLNLIDKRLDRIQPKLRQFFGTLNQTSFNLKVDKFLKFLVTQSKLSKIKQIQFPENILTYKLWWPTTNFTIVERRNDLFPIRSRPRSSVYELREEREAELLKPRRTLMIHSQVDEWLTHILTDAARGIVNFSDYFFAIVETEKGDIELATKAAYALVRLSTMDLRLQIEIGQHKIYHPNYPRLAIWEMTIMYQR